jgi:hypothetical protein
MNVDICDIIRDTSAITVGSGGANAESYKPAITASSMVIVPAN